ncbi:uncharacterized protein LAESUDRAFT_650016, partial [Laetiporus sulphureus 93-53]
PLSNRSNSDIGQPAEMSSKQTPWQRRLAHLAQHGFNDVSAGPGDVGSDSISEESLKDSYLNNGMLITTLSGAASVTGSNIGSIGSMKGRLSKFSSLNFM